MIGRGAPALVALLLAASPAAAAPPAPGAPPSDLVADASGVLGPGGGTAVGWNEVVVVVQNNGAKLARGRAEVTTGAYGGERREFVGQAPFAVGPGAAVHLRVPVRVVSYGDVTVDVLDEEGHTLVERSLSSFVPHGVSLVDVSEVSHLRGALGEVPVSPLFWARGRGSSPVLTIGWPRFDPATGDPILPDRAALYTSADAVLMRSDTLVRLPAADLEALAGYVLAGGTLAVAVARPEDVRHATVSALAGGSISRTGVPEATLADFSLPPAAGRFLARARAPSGDVAERLAGYTGGNLHGSLYGSSAAYGLGEVHLLAFDPTEKRTAEDPWVQARMVDLTRRAFDRRSSQIFRPGAEGTDTSYGRVRRVLDPNESSRWAIGAAAILLLAYALLAGPLNFTLASRSGRPLRALRRLPLFAALAFAMVVGVGIVAKGIAGRARRLTLVEAGAGMGQGSARRFRGFYISRARDLTVRTSDRGSVLSTLQTDHTTRMDRLVVDREGARLIEVSALPWQTVVVREDGLASLGDGIALVREGEGGTALVNRTGRDLRAALVRVPGGETYYFPRVRDGERVRVTSGRKLSADPDGRAWVSQTRPYRSTGTLALHRLGEDALSPFTDPDAPGLADAWGAISEAAGDNVDWFPEGVPVVVGQLDGGEGRPTDTGLRVESDRLLVRVVGWGGRP
jgi:hypothetical protein